MAAAYDPDEPSSPEEWEALDSAQSTFRETRGASANLSADYRGKIGPEIPVVRAHPHTWHGVILDGCGEG